MGLLPKNHVALAKRSRLPMMEARFANGASFGMIFASFKGDEPVVIGRLTPIACSNSRCPVIHRRSGWIWGRMQPLEPHLHTVSIRPDDLALDLIWRGAAGVSRLRLALEDEQARGECPMSALTSEALSGGRAAEQGGERTLLPGQSPRRRIHSERAHQTQLPDCSQPGDARARTRIVRSWAAMSTGITR
jgi:hypothetical protein